MQINNISNTNFQGSFLIKKAAPELGAEVMSSIRQGRSVYRNVERKGDLFIVARDNLDKRIKRFLEDKNISFEYFPQLNTKEGSYYVTKEHELQPLIADLRVANGHRKRIPKRELAEPAATNRPYKMEPKASILKLTDDGQLLMYEEKAAQKAVAKKAQEPPKAAKAVKKDIDIRPISDSLDYVKNIATSYKLDLGMPVKNIRGARIIELPEVSSKILISKPDQKGHHYIMIKTTECPNNRFVMNR